MRRILHRMRLGMRGLLACVLLACLLVAGLPATAWADDDYDLTKTDIAATVGRDGLLYVTEERTLDLDGDFHGFYWQIDTGPGELGDVSVEIREAGEVASDGSLMPYRFVDGKSDTPGTWTMEQGRGYTRVDVHYEKSYEEARFYVTYALDGVAERFADTGELYWKFVGDRWEKDSSNVTCTVYFDGGDVVAQRGELTLLDAAHLPLGIEHVDIDTVYTKKTIGNSRSRIATRGHENVYCAFAADEMAEHAGHETGADILESQRGTMEEFERIDVFLYFHYGRWEL